MVANKILASDLLKLAHQEFRLTQDFIVINEMGAFKYNIHY